ncbi:hypothetical protein KDK95_30620 [Actinospica sp. MGRD01-02]|uniref:Uncharacterized protein n=1 Tax=Actinospica acidithermotolerans TaxID=2828514 RepID=A0A941IPR5_9ACTN|nr:hypothetical protein [Actinospica acidithermotolerans]MBR7830696.1 hypothetical protein [Actinospica acidithermotolerans]
MLEGTIAAITLAGLYSAALLTTHRAGRRSEIALGPFMTLGTLATLAAHLPAR